MSENAALLIIGACLGLLQLLTLYWVGRVENRIDAQFKKSEKHAIKLANHNGRIRTVENLCGVEHSEVEA